MRQQVVATAQGLDPLRDRDRLEAAAEALGGRLEEREGHGRVHLDRPVPRERLEAVGRELGLDLNPWPEGFDPRRVGLLLSDMDSTLVAAETIDEIAAFAGLKPQVAAITEAAMRGELDFAEALRRRVALLRGLEAAVLDRVWEEGRLPPSPGAEALVAGLRRRGIRAAVVSGGFEHFTARLARRLGLDAHRANRLAVEGGRLTGELAGPVVDARAKAAYLEELCGRWGLRPEQVVAVGDGANDLPMLRRAGLGVAWRAKPVLRAAAPVRLDRSGLDAILAFLEP